MPAVVMAPMSGELAPFLQGLRPEPIFDGDGADRVAIYTGQHQGLPLIAARTGLGKVNTALATQLLIDRYRPEAIVQVGLAGAISADLQIGDVVIGTEFVQHDVDLTVPCGLQPGEIAFDIVLEDGRLHVPMQMRQSRFAADKRLVALADAATRQKWPIPAGNSGLGRTQFVQGTIVTGDQFISSEKETQRLRKDFNPLAAEMEGAAAAHVCHLSRVPFIGIRAISDRADHTAHLDIATFLPVAAQCYHTIVVHMLNGWYKGRT